MSDRWLVVDSKDFLFLTSDALYSIKSYPNSLANNLTKVVLPIPGGPEIKQALALGFSTFPNLKLVGFLFPRMTTDSQS